MNDFCFIGITTPDMRDGEASEIEALLRSDALDICHIRKPEIGDDEIESLIAGIPHDLHPRLRLHSAFRLCYKYDIGGVHLNHRTPHAPADMRVSASLHSIGELRQCADAVCKDVKVCECSDISIPSGRLDYVSLSPIFDSISKTGYRSAFNITDPAFVAEIRHLGAHGLRIMALGGVKPEFFSQLKASGFAGAMLLGYIWGSKNHIAKICDELRCQREHLRDICHE